MELWIRSQDKEALLKVNNGLMYWEDTDKRNCVVIKETSTNLSVLGAYKTKERALEVLDDIYSFVNNNGFTGEEEYNASSGCYRMKNRKIYDMPKE